MTFVCASVGIVAWLCSGKTQRLGLLASQLAGRAVAVLLPASSVGRGQVLLNTIRRGTEDCPEYQQCEGGGAALRSKASVGPESGGVSLRPSGTGLLFS